jgi:uncharacterized protein (TIGR02231 family)
MNEPVVPVPIAVPIVAVPIVAPIVAVSVYPDRARITRRGSVRLTTGDQVVHVEPLPPGLHADSVRVSGRGPATVLGVDVVTRHHPTTPDERAAALEAERLAILAELRDLADADDVQVKLDAFLEQLGRRAGGSYARSLAAGDSGPETLSEFTESYATRLAEVRRRRRELAQARRMADERLAEVDRKLAAIEAHRAPDRLAASVTLAVRADGDVEVELSYVVSGAGWRSAYDVRLAGDRLTLHWYGLVSQHSGEDWPECALTLSTARPAEAAEVPELDPWYLDRYRPPAALARSAHPEARYAMAAPGSGAPAGEPPAGGAAKVLADFDEAYAGVEQGVAAASYTPARPVAVPADGGEHRATLAAVDLEATLDYVTAPVLGTDAHVRATVVNSSEHTMPAGRAAVFHEADFVGSTDLPVWAPGEEVELALGVDDRIRVERELVRRTAGRATLGSTRRREVEYRITVANHTPRQASVTVLDQLPVARDHEITVKPLELRPEPVEHTDLGVLTWRLDLAPGAEREIHLGVRVETGKNVELAGWRE